MFQLSELLGHAIKRARVSTQVSATQIVTTADEFLSNILGPRKKDVRVVSFQNGLLTVETLHSAASHFIKEHEPELRIKLHEDHPEHPFREVRYHVVHRFRKSEL